MLYRCSSCKCILECVVSPNKLDLHVGVILMDLSELSPR